MPDIQTNASLSTRLDALNEAWNQLYASAIGRGLGSARVSSKLAAVLTSEREAFRTWKESLGFWDVMLPVPLELWTDLAAYELKYSNVRKAVAAVLTDPSPLIDPIDPPGPPTLRLPSFWEIVGGAILVGGSVVLVRELVSRKGGRR